MRLHLRQLLVLLNRFVSGNMLLLRGRAQIAIGHVLHKLGAALIAYRSKPVVPITLSSVLFLLVLFVVGLYFVSHVVMHREISPWEWFRYLLAYSCGLLLTAWTDKVRLRK